LTRSAAPVHLDPPDTARRRRRSADRHSGDNRIPAVLARRRP